MIISNISSEAIRPIVTKFHGESSGLREQKFVRMVSVTWPTWLPYHLTVKIFKNLLHRNQWTDDLET